MTSARRVLVVEDDPAQRADLVDYLRFKGFDAHGAASAAQMWALGAADSLVLLDIGLPDGSGLAVADALRQRHPETGVVMLTAYDADRMRVEGLSLGADAYLVKGASLEVIEATCRSVMRRLGAQVAAPAATAAPAPGSDWRLLPEQCRLLAPDGRPVDLTVTELSFMQQVMARPGTAVSRAELLAAMLRPETLNNIRNLDGCAARLRRKVEDTLGLALPLRSFYGRGYVFTGEAHCR